MDFGYAAARPLLFRMNAEQAHRLTLDMMSRLGGNAAGRHLARKLYAPRPDPRLEMEAFGLRFPNPLGLAAGVDKDGEAIEAWAALGFGFVELGTVTPAQGQPGNASPRLARLVADRAVVNRLGFPNHGADQLAARLADAKKGGRVRAPLGANIGKAKLTPNAHALDDYRATLRSVFPVADYVVVNVSSPNTPGLRDLQTVEVLRPLLRGVLDERQRLSEDARPGRPSLLLKVAPDLADEDVDAVADLAVELGLDGIVATNTTLRHELVRTAPPIAGGLSGAPLEPRARELTQRLFRRLEGRMPIVGVGGIMSAEDAWRRIRSGATLLQTYTGLIYEGPGLIRSVVEGLGTRLDGTGLARLSEAVGADC